MPRTPKTTGGDAPKKRVPKTTSPAEGSTKVTKTTKAAQSANSTTVEASVATNELPSSPINGRAPASQARMEERVRIRAYELYLRRGGVGGSPEQDWFQAMSEIHAESVA